MVVVQFRSIYAIVCDLKNRAAVECLYRIKNMDAKKPLSILCRSFQDTDTYTMGFHRGNSHGHTNVFLAARQCLPGPYTFILPANKEMPKQCTNFGGSAGASYAPRKSVAVRMPDDEICKVILAKLDEPLVCTSVRRPADDEWMLDPVIIADTYGAFEGKEGLDFVVDGGVRIADPSTVVDITTAKPTLLRRGKKTTADTLSFTPGKSDLLVVGPGVLGSLVAQQWFKVHEGECNVVGQTNTTNRHEQLRSIGIIPVTKDTHKGETFPYVIFCAPPSGSEDYAAEVRAAAERWNGEGSLLFTSSSALYAVSDNGICDEETAPIVPKGAGPRTDRLHGAEEEVLKVGGSVVRLAGLYALERGAHSYYLSQGTIAQRGDHIVNLIHYEDAASLCVTVLRGQHRGRIFLGCDNHPVSRQEIMDAVDKSGKYDKKFEGFTTSDGPLGKKMNNDPTRRATGWKPKYESFPSFLGVES